MIEIIGCILAVIGFFATIMTGRIYLASFDFNIWLFIPFMISISTLITGLYMMT